MRRFISCSGMGGPKLKEYISANTRSIGQRSYSSRYNAEIVPVRCRPLTQWMAIGKFSGLSNSR